MSVECRGATLQPRSALVSLPVTSGMFHNRLKRGANDAYNHSHIHAPTLNRGHPICVDLRTFHRLAARHRRRRRGDRERLIATGSEAGLKLFTKAKLAPEVSLPALEKIYVRLAAVRAPEGNLDDRCLRANICKISLGSNRKLGLAFGVLFGDPGPLAIVSPGRFAQMGADRSIHRHPGRRTPSPLLDDAIETRMVQGGSRLEPNRRSLSWRFFSRNSRPAWLYLCRKGEDLLRLKGNSQGRILWIEREPPASPTRNTGLAFPPSR